MRIQTTTLSRKTVFCEIALGEDLESVLVRASNEAAAQTGSATADQIVVHADGSPVLELEKAFEYGFSGKPEPVIGGEPELVRLAYQAWKFGRDSFEDGDA